MHGKTLNSVNIDDAKKKVQDLVVVGNGDAWQLLGKASSESEGWMKSTKAYEIEGTGCMVQVTTQQGDHVAEAVVFVPFVRIVEDINGGKRLEPLRSDGAGGFS